MKTRDRTERRKEKITNVLKALQEAREAPPSSPAEASAVATIGSMIASKSTPEAERRRSSSPQYLHEEEARQMEEDAKLATKIQEEEREAVEHQLATDAKMAENLATSVSPSPTSDEGCDAHMQEVLSHIATTFDLVFRPPTKGDAITFTEAIRLQGDKLRISEHLNASIDFSGLDCGIVSTLEEEHAKACERWQQQLDDIGFSLTHYVVDPDTVLPRGEWTHAMCDVERRWKDAAWDFDAWYKPLEAQRKSATWRDVTARGTSIPSWPQKKQGRSNSAPQSPVRPGSMMRRTSLPGYLSMDVIAKGPTSPTIRNTLPASCIMGARNRASATIVSPVKRTQPVPPIPRPRHLYPQASSTPLQGGEPTPMMNTATTSSFILPPVAPNEMYLQLQELTHSTAAKLAELQASYDKLNSVQQTQLGANSGEEGTRAS